MVDWLRNSGIYEINTWAWLQDWSKIRGRRVSLGEVPGEAWDRVARLEVSAVWLMGVWERSPAGVALSLQNPALTAELRQQVPGLHASDVVGSPYCIRRYRVDERLGGPTGLAAARKALAARNIRLVLDFVPNHVAPDHPWVTDHPEWLLRGSRRELQRSPDAFLEVAGNVFARGRDPYFPPWSDVLQLNAYHAGQRAAALSELQRIAEQCDGVRCDMAMLVMNEVFARTWGRRTTTKPDREYWDEVISGLRSSNPGFCFLAEGYWNLESRLLEQGFDACYDKDLYDALAHGSAERVRNHLLRYAPVQDRLVRFLENHDEPRAARVFPWPKGSAAALVLMTLPGIRLLHDGQIEGRTIRAQLHLGSRPAEPTNTAVEDYYLRLFPLTGNTAFRAGQWTTCETSGWPDNPSHRQLLSWCWRNDSDRWLVIVNYSAEAAQGHVLVPWEDVRGKTWWLTDTLSGTAYDRSGDELAGPGLFVELPAWAGHVFRFEAER